MDILKSLPKAGTSVGELAAADIRKAEVFKKWGIDFCCGGKKTVAQACVDQGIDVAVVEAALNNCNNQQAAGIVFDFNRWTPYFLADYIYNQHHLYYYENAPMIADLLQKVVARHGNHFPELYKVVDLYQQLQQELKAHFLKEERVLFPFIKALEGVQNSADASTLPAGPAISEPIEMMQTEHEAAGNLLAALRNATNDFTAPAGGCNSFRLLYQKLHDLEEDLHQHIHLENNILFPKVLALEKELQNKSL